MWFKRENRENDVNIDTNPTFFFLFSAHIISFYLPETDCKLAHEIKVVWNTSYRSDNTTYLLTYSKENGRNPFISPNDKWLRQSRRYSFQNTSRIWMAFDRGKPILSFQDYRVFEMVLYMLADNSITSDLVLIQDIQSFNKEAILAKSYEEFFNWIRSFQLYIGPSSR